MCSKTKAPFSQPSVHCFILLLVTIYSQWRACSPPEILVGHFDVVLNVLEHLYLTQAISQCV